MKKIIILFIFLLLPLQTFALEIDINSKSAIVINRDNNEILYKKNIEEQYTVASLTKIMTTIVALENITDFNEVITIKWPDIANLAGYTILGLQYNTEITYKDLLYSTILCSAADSAMALANNVFNSYDEFINKMNELAQKLNMKDTHFSNPVGFDDNNYSTAYDISLLLDYALKNKNFYEIYTTKTYYVELVDKTLVNSVRFLINKFEVDDKGITFNGTKTGFTTLSGLCFSGITDLNNNEIMIITLNAEGDFKDGNNIKDSIKIADAIKKSYSNKIILNKGKLIDNIIYKKGKKEYTYYIKSMKDITYYMNNSLNLDYLKIYYDGITTLNENIKENEKIGTIKIYYNDKLLISEEVLFNKNNIEKPEQKKYAGLFILIPITICILLIFRKKKKDK